MVQPSKQKPRMIYVEDSLWEWAKGRALYKGETVSALVRHALERFKDEVEADQQPSEER